MKIVIKNGMLIDPAQSIEAERDVLIDNGRVEDIRKPGELSHLRGADEMIDATGCWVVPGLIDGHVHLREPGYEWKETVASGARAAVLGGFTSVCCMANTSPVNDHAEITRFICERGASAGFARVFPLGSVSRKLEGKEMSPLAEIQKAGGVAFSDDGKPVYDPLLMRRALEWAKMLGAPICCHEEDTCLAHGGCMNESPLSLRLGLKGMPKVAEDVMVSRDIELARLTGGHVHFCHLSSARSVELVRRAKADGINVTAEVTPHHLHLTEERIGQYDTLAKMNPPLRESEDCEALLAGLADGTIDIVASDHAPHERDTKEVEFDKASFGIIGLQSTLPLMLKLVDQGRLSRKRFIEAQTTLPAKIFGLSGLGSLAVGATADVVVINPKHSWKYESTAIESLSKNTPWIGTEFSGRAETVLVGGKIVVKGGKVEKSA